MAVLDMLREDSRLADLTWKESAAKEQPFRKMRVRLKKEIVTMGVPEVDPCTLVGTYVQPEEWNALIADPEVIVIDTRNDYEIEIGTNSALAGNGRARDLMAQPEDDPWNFWVFRINANARASGESSRTNRNINASVSANRTTEEWIFRLRAETSYRESITELLSLIHI